MRWTWVDWWLATLIGISLAICSLGFLWSYSYWFDELYSVVGAQSHLGTMMQLYVLPDVHPPGYTLVLHGWQALFGAQERATRSLSLLGAAISVWLFYRTLASRYTPRTVLCGLALFTTPWIFSYYAQETRAYSLMICLATLVMVLTLRYIERRTSLVGLLVGCIALSLTHYFGLLYAGMTLLALLYWARHDRGALTAIVATGLICLIWPVIHVIYGALGGHTGGEFWIGSLGFRTTLSMFVRALFPALPVAADFALPEAKAQLITALAVIAVFTAVAWLIRKQTSLLTLWLVVSGVLVVAVAIDQLSPISNHRNFAVLLPAIALTITALIDRYRSPAIFIGVALICSVNLAGAGAKIADKIRPLEDWTVTARLAGDNAFYLLNDPINRPIMDRITNFYAGQRIRPVLEQEIRRLDRPFEIVVSHQIDAARRIARRSPGIELTHVTDRTPDLVVLSTRPGDSRTSGEP